MGNGTAPGGEGRDPERRLIGAATAVHHESVPSSKCAGLWPALQTSDAYPRERLPVPSLPAGAGPAETRERFQTPGHPVAEKGCGANFGAPDRLRRAAPSGHDDLIHFSAAR